MARLSCEKKGAVHKYSHSFIHSKSRHHDGYLSKVQRLKTQYSLRRSSQCGGKWIDNYRTVVSTMKDQPTGAQRQGRIFHVAWEGLHGLPGKGDPSGESW